MRFGNLSIIVPTLNVRHLVEPIADQMREVFAEAGEVIVVDSFSEDGTLDYLKEILDFEQASFHSRPRGLYASWNYGINRATKKWIHIGTAGDILGLEDLQHLYDVADEREVDVVVSGPRFCNESGEVIADMMWPIFSLLERYPESDFVELAGDELVSFALSHCRPGQFNGWLGSSASNIYRAETLKEYPFPTDVGPIGDSLWGLQHAGSVRACFCRRRCGRFVIHNLERAHIPDSRTGEIFGRLWVNTAEALVEKLVPADGRDEFMSFLLTLFERELLSGELARKQRQRMRVLRDRQDLYADYIYESRGRIPRLLKRLLLPSLRRGQYTLHSEPLSDESILKRDLTRS